MKVAVSATVTASRVTVCRRQEGTLVTPHSVANDGSKSTAQFGKRFSADNSLNSMATTKLKT